MKEETRETIKKLRKLYVEIAFDERFEAKMPEEVRAAMIEANIKVFEKMMLTLNPIKQGYVEAIFSDPMALDALNMACLLTHTTRKLIEGIIVGKVIEQVMLDELANSNPKGSA